MKTQDPFDDCLDAFRRHNEQQAMKRLEVHDPVQRETARQRQIINAALVSLADGNTQRTRELLGQL